MRLDSRSGVRGLLMNLDTGKPIRWVRWADVPESTEQQGEFEAFRCNPEQAKAQGIPLSEIIYRGKCRMRFVPAAPRIPGKPSNQRDLSGSLDDARKRLVEPKLLIPGEECEYPGCHNLSAFRCSEEVEIEPEVDAEGKAYERAVTVRVRCYCSNPKHYRNPVFTSIRGVQSEVAVEEGRPK
jgi:hypothetical protein